MVRVPAHLKYLLASEHLWQDYVFMCVDYWSDFSIMVCVYSYGVHVLRTCTCIYAVHVCVVGSLVHMYICMSSCV